MKQQRIDKRHTRERVKYIENRYYIHLVSNFYSLDLFHTKAFNVSAIVDLIWVSKTYYDLATKLELLFL